MIPESYPGDNDPTEWLLAFYLSVQRQYDYRVDRGEVPEQVRASMLVATVAQEAITRRAIEDAAAGLTDPTQAAADVVWKLPAKCPSSKSFRP